MRNRHEKLAEGSLFCLFLKAPSAVHSYRVPGKFIRRLKVYSSSTNKAKIYSYSIFVQQMYWLQDKRWYWNKFTAMSYATHNKWNKITCGKFDIWYIQYWRPEIAVCKQSVHLLYKYAIRINFCFIRTRRINFQPTNKLSWYPVAMYSGGHI
jgi:hypothetical protein